MTGKFWHGKDWFERKNDLKTNQEFWIKIERNIQRDIQVNEELAKQGWTILRFWSKEIEKDLLNCVLQIENAIKELEMDLTEKISLETFGNKQFRIKLVEPDNNQEIILSHYLYNSKKLRKTIKSEQLNLPKKF